MTILIPDDIAYCYCIIAYTQENLLTVVITLLQSSCPPEIGLQLWENNLILALTMTAGNEAHC